MRYPLLRWLTMPLIVAALVGSHACPALHAQEQGKGQGPPPPAMFPMSRPAAPPAAPPSLTKPPAPDSIIPAADLTTPPTATTLPHLDIHRIVHNQRGDTRPLLIDASEVVTWKENEGSSPFCALMLRGTVLVQQGIMQARFENGVAWIDLARYRAMGELYVQIYAEGRVRIEDGAPVEVPRAVFELTTRGLLKLNSYKSKLTQQLLADDPLVQRARAEKLGPPTLLPHRADANVIQPVRYEQRQLVLPPTVDPQTAMPPAPYPPAALPGAPQPGSVPLAPPRYPGSRQSWLPAGPQERSLARGEATMVFRMAAPDEEGSSGVVPVAATTTQQGGDPGGAAPPAPVAESAPAPAPPPGGVPSSPGIPPGPAGTEPIPGPQPVVPAPAPLPLPPPSRPQRPPAGAPLLLPTRNYVVAPRSSSARFNAKIEKVGDEQAIIITGGIILNVRNAPGIGFIDMEADRLVIWTRDLDAAQVLGGMQKKEGHSSDRLEFYLSGNVVIRQAPVNNPKREERTIRATEVYYDVNRNVAIITQGEVQIKQPTMREGVYFRSPEIEQTSATTFRFKKGEAFSSKLPSDPGLRLYITDATVEEKSYQLKNLFGTPQVDRITGQPVIVNQTIMSSSNLLFDLEGVPVFYLPYSKIDLRDPLGPVQDFMFGFNRIFGMQLGVSLNVYELLGIQPLQGIRWLLNLDYLSYRGPGLGTTVDYGGVQPFGIPGRYNGILKLFGIYDRDYDNLGGPRPFNNFRPDNVRGRELWQHIIDDMPYGFSSVNQVALESDRNFLEQYYKREFDLNPDRITVGEVQQQQNNWAWSLLAQGQTRPWATETSWLPRADGWLVGQSFFNTFTYNTHANVAYAQLRRTTDIGQQVDPITDQSINTGRADWMQELSTPIQLGGLKIVPFGILDLTAYSAGLPGPQGTVGSVPFANYPYVIPHGPEEGNPIGRVWGGGGLRASLPFSRVYPSVASELFNLNGINHKIVFTFDYLGAGTNVSHYQLPQLDRLNDHTTEQAYRDALNADPILYPDRPFLVNNVIYDPQIYALRSMNLWRVDTLDNIDVLNFSVRQRWQTKRGYPGSQHIVDWMIFDFGASFFPDANNQFGLPYLRSHYPFLYPYAGANGAVANTNGANILPPTTTTVFSDAQLLNYNYQWNIGDRTALESTGLFDPFTNGIRVFTLGGYFNRPDRTNFYLGYRQIDPLNARVATLSVTYVFSPKYAITGNTMYDFGNKQSLGNSLMFTRIGTDLQVSLGFNYNVMQNNFGVLFNVIPNLLPANRAMGPIGSSGTSSQGMLK